MSQNKVTFRISLDCWAPAGFLCSLLIISGQNQKETAEEGHEQSMHEHEQTVKRNSKNNFYGKGEAFKYYSADFSGKRGNPHTPNK